MVHLEVRDNGRACLTAAPDGHGPSHHEHRARVIGASLRIHEQAGGGTVVSCYFDAASGYYLPEPEAIP